MITNKRPTKVLIELPNWLGDCVMSTPAIENIIKHYIDIEITIIGSSNSIELIKNHEKVVNAFKLDTKNKLSFKQFSTLDFFDVYFTFRSSLRAKLTKLIVKATNKYQFNHSKFKKRHQVEKYVDFVNESLNINLNPGNLVCHINLQEKNKNSKILGINPGASYGSAKRLYPENLAKIATKLSNSFDIVIFGGIEELQFAKDIEKYLLRNNVKNYKNLAGKTSITELTQQISNLDIFITGDSGPMHIAASLQIPTITLFGPTNPKETSQWKNPLSVILKKNLDCQPCMKRTCPLKHHNCMKLIEANEVIESIALVEK